MSAKYEDRDGFTFLPTKKLSEFQETILNVAFDNQIHFDILEAEELVKEKKVLKRVCIYNIVLFPLQYMFTFMLFGREYASERKILFKLSIKYLRKKITVDEFKKELNNMVENGKML